MTKRCFACQQQVSQSELKCVFCRHLFHLKCGKVDLVDAAVINKHTSFHWNCSNCDSFLQSDMLMTIFAKINSLEKMMTTLNHNLPSQSKPSLSKPAEAIPSPSLPKPKNKVPIIIQKRITRASSNIITTPTSKPSTSNDDSSSLLNKTFTDVLLEEESSVAHTVKSPLPLVSTVTAVSTATAIDTPAAVEFTIPVAVDEVKWIYVSRLRPDTTAETMENYLKSKLSTDDITSKLLIPRGKHLSEMKSVAFKMSIPITKWEEAKSLTLWPPGVSIRDFKQLSTRRTLSSSNKSD